MSSDTNATTLPTSTRDGSLDSDRQKKLEESIKTSNPHPLANQWTFYLFKYVANATPKEYEENLKKVATVSTVQNFWAVYNNIIGPDELSSRCSLHFMKSDIHPAWEDPRNENGGAWSFRVTKANTVTVWRELLMMLIGEQFEDCVSKDDDIYGITVSSRYNSDIFNIWNKNSAVSEEAKIMEKIKDALASIELQSPYYKAHKDHADFHKVDTPTSATVNGKGY
ncbi:eukaryotic translation initiation factor 4E type 3 [Gigaspora margarita]|uniref:Eukaryotic translation initiation factor 4E type 3 n=1 Tax=Gigaspora margarita TaxID=4874 RepID=A0A8H4ADP3_GIGMA|nr:eukaryotic translation initiation factor 4E type 3 [Gigaspora margarita]